MPLRAQAAQVPRMLAVLKVSRSFELQISLRKCADTGRKYALVVLCPCRLSFASVTHFACLWHDRRQRCSGLKCHCIDEGSGTQPGSAAGGRDGPPERRPP
jgi:hypothetical protein